MNPLAQELNEILDQGNPHLMEMLSTIGKKLFFPKGLLTQGAEAKEKAHRMNATIGIAKEKGKTMQMGSITQAVKEIRPSRWLTYAPSYGIPEIRHEWQKAIRQKNPSIGDQPLSLPVVTNGITHSVSVFSDLWVDPGDAIVLPKIRWGNYNLIFEVKKEARFFEYTLFGTDGKLDLDAFEKAVRAGAADRGKVIVMLNFPHNPTGYTPLKEEGEQITGILKELADEGVNVIAVMDDAYFGLFYEPDIMHESLFGLLCGIHPRVLAVKLDGATKENYVWGLRVGFTTYGCQVTGDYEPVFNALERKTAGCVRSTISNASHLGQTLILESMQSDAYGAEKKAKYDILKSRALKVKTVSTDPKYKDAWDVYPFNSGYFMCIRVKGVDAEALRQHLLNTYGVGLISLGSTDLRVAFSCIEEEEVAPLFDLIQQGIKELKEAG